MEYQIDPQKGYIVIDGYFSARGIKSVKEVVEKRFQNRLKTNYYYDFINWSKTEYEVLVGIILGMLMGFGIAAAMNFVFVIPWMAILIAFATSFMVAIVSGLYPAIKASKLDPIEALRYE